MIWVLLPIFPVNPLIASVYGNYKKIPLPPSLLLHPNTKNRREKISFPSLHFYIPPFLSIFTFSFLPPNFLFKQLFTCYFYLMIHCLFVVTVIRELFPVHLVSSIYLCFSNVILLMSIFH